MKLKTLLKVVNATKISITVQTDGEYHDYDIDYVNNKELVNVGSYTKCRTVLDLPKAVTDREVTFVNVHDDWLKISVYEKERGE